MEYCPVCRARFKGMPVCRRCKSDLTDLIALENQAEYIMIQAMQHLRSGNISRARQLCAHSEILQCTEFGATLLGFLDILALEEKKSTEDVLWHRRM
jgi:DNA-binding SARP family transcriptional activator